jgi:allantoinase
MILRSRNVLTRAGLRPASVHVRGGRIERVGDFDDVPEGAPVDDYGALTIMAGIVDSHVHVNEPGRAEWEGFDSATRAAAAGGVTTIVDMPLNSIPATTSLAALHAKAAAMEGKCRVDVGLWGGAVPGNAGALGEMLRGGALGFKCFLVDSGVPEFGHLDAAILGEALAALRGKGAPLLVHAELPGPLRPLRGDATTYRAYLESRPPAAEDQAIELLLAEARRAGTPAHVVHLSSAGALDSLRRARDARVPLTAETTPHYLYFDAERIPDGATEFKCAPPIREHHNRERLWAGVKEGLITAIVSDHSPCTPELKRREEGDFDRAWGGIASLQFGLPIVWTEARRRGVGIERLSELMSEGPARLAGIDARKGTLDAGYDADLVVWDPDARFTVTPEIIHHRHNVTPYAGEELFGVVKTTFVRGAKVWDDGAHTANAQGLWIQRPA